MLQCTLTTNAGPILSSDLKLSYSHLNSCLYLSQSQHRDTELIYRLGAPSKFSRISELRFERRKVDLKKQTYMKTEICKLYPRVF